MKISDELIACYVEGNVTAEERNFVRKYLCEHPEEYERILCLIDNDTVDYLGERLEISADCLPVGDIPFSDISYSAAAFAPAQNRRFTPKNNSKPSKANELYDRLSKMSDELDEII